MYLFLLLSLSLSLTHTHTHTHTHTQLIINFKLFPTRLKSFSYFIKSFLSDIKIKFDVKVGSQNWCLTRCKKKVKTTFVIFCLSFFQKNSIFFQWCLTRRQGFKWNLGTKLLNKNIFGTLSNAATFCQKSICQMTIGQEIWEEYLWWIKMLHLQTVN